MTHACPKCQRTLKQDGEIDFNGEVYRVYSCDECLVNWEFDGETFEINLTFGITPDGKMIDPNAPHKPIYFD